jgi:hypothetical protein
MEAIKSFYKLRDKFTSRSFQAGKSSMSEKMVDGVLPYEFRVLSGDYTGIKFPVTFHQQYGKVLGDLMSIGHAVLFLISDQMKALFEDEGFTGWQTYPVIVYDKKGVEVLGYHGFSITGHCGPIDYSKCEVITKRYVPHGPEVRLLKGLYVGLDQWDGSDFFLPTHYYGTICTARVVEAVRRAKLTLIDFKNLSEIETDEDDVIKRMKRDAERQT